jgi:hypothetical protein
MEKNRIKRFNENSELNISDVRSSNYSMVTKEGLYKIIHDHYATDRYQIWNYNS